MGVIPGGGTDVGKDADPANDGSVVIIASSSDIDLTTALRFITWFDIPVRQKRVREVTCHVWDLDDANAVANGDTFALGAMTKGVLPKLDGDDDVTNMILYTSW
mmetsp:Transcript_4429/g.9825  ORF Transcript_4429/g.9825 Transcript_4429/m.9825 type:complete len:104 (+) Transcript_4429:648-959(+)